MLVLEGRAYVRICLWPCFPQGISRAKGSGWVLWCRLCSQTSYHRAWENTEETDTHMKGKTPGILVTCLSPKHITSVSEGPLKQHTWISLLWSFPCFTRTVSWNLPLTFPGVVSQRLADSLILYAASFGELEKPDQKYPGGNTFKLSH